MGGGGGGGGGGGVGGGGGAVLVWNCVRAGVMECVGGFRYVWGFEVGVFFGAGVVWW